MSDISALSHDYESTARFAELVNTAVLNLKKSLRRGGRAVPSPSETADLADIVRAVKHQVEKRSPESMPAVPSEVVERLTIEHKTQLGYLVDDLSSAERALSGNSPVDSEVIRVLDEICDAADASASAMFRRLRRR